MINVITELTEEKRLIWSLIEEEDEERTYQAVDGELTLTFRYGIAPALKLHAVGEKDVVFDQLSYEDELAELQDGILGQFTASKK
jgi:hypothetical protein